MQITIDGRKLEAQAGQTILEVARENNIYIPSLCWHPRTGKAGKCRSCLVEVENVRGLKTSCTEDVRDGMVVNTETEPVLAARRMVVELLLANGKHNCLSCESNGACELQDAAYSLGIETPSFVIDTEDIPPDESSEGIIVDHNKCIQCGRCIAGDNNNVVHSVLAMGFRGHEEKVVCDNDIPMGESDCVQCGECVQLCPVGAIIDKRAKGTARNWETTKTRVTCPYCGVGCQIDMHTKDNQFIKATAYEENWQKQPNKGMLCVKGRFGLDYVQHPDRLTDPLIRKNGELVKATWDEALDYTAKRFLEIKKQHGSDSLGVLASAKISNEENFQAMKFARAVLGTNNVDHCARLCHSSTVAGLATTLGSGAMTNSMEECLKSDVILIIGTNTTHNHPVLGGMMKQAVKFNGVKIIVCDPRRIDLVDHSTIWVQQRNGSDVALLSGIQHIILKEGWEDKEYIKERCEGYEEYRKSMEFFTPEKVEELTGVSQKDLYEIAKLYATGGTAALYFSMGITQHTHGVDNVKSTANLAMITGNLGIEGGGVNPLRGQSNVQGACDMGALPNVFSGYQKVTDEAANKKFRDAWNAEIPLEIGMTVTQMIPECGGKIKGLYIIGENPMISDPNLNHVKECMEKLDFLVVQDIFPTETVAMADVVLPAPVFAEKLGTFTNTERRVQLSNQALNSPGNVRQDYEITADIAERMGYSGFYRTPEEIFEEIRRLTPSYAGMSYDRNRELGLCWPCPAEDHPGTPILHKGKFARGLGLLTPMEYRPPAEEPDEQWPMRLSTGRMLEHFHTGSMSRRSVVLDGMVPCGMVEINPADAETLGIMDGETVRVSSRRGSIDTQAWVMDRVAKGSMFIPFHFAEAAANMLTNDALDPVSKIPEFKVCAAKLEKIG
ncbi:MAG: formate dehydrogenase subunit alpha [Sedimentisphaerales bacterium]|nr:formate dehydrogenase subunit alpha [Sedimentisphaerales bacterium]